MSKSSIKSFKTSARTPTDGDTEPVTFELDDKVYHAHRPKDSRLIMLANAADDNLSAAHEAMKFIDACLPPAERRVFANRLADPDDDLDLDVAIDIFRYLLSEFTGRPTESQSD